MQWLSKGVCWKKLGGHGQNPASGFLQTGVVFLEGLGLKVSTVTPELRLRFGLKAAYGSLVIAIDRGGPAAAAKADSLDSIAARASILGVLQIVLP